MGFIRKLVNGKLRESAINHFENAYFISGRQKAKIKKAYRYGDYFIIYDDKKSDYLICEFHANSQQQDERIKKITKEGFRVKNHGTRLTPTDSDIHNITVDIRTLYC